MELLSAIALTCCLLTGTPDVPTGVAENLQLNNIYIEFPQELKPYLTEEQEDFLETTYTTVDDEIQIQVTEILAECEEKKIQEEERIKAEEEARRRIAEEQAKYEARCAEVGNKVLDAISRTSSPGSGWCAKWVSMVYQNAGYKYISGNACDMYWNYCTSADRGQLKNGMLIAVPSWNGSYMSRTYGHIGIYIDGYVWHNVGSIDKTPVDEWISQYGDIYQVQWGYPIEV